MIVKPWIRIRTWILIWIQIGPKSWIQIQNQCNWIHNTVTFKRLPLLPGHGAYPGLVAQLIPAGIEQHSRVPHHHTRPSSPRLTQTQGARLGQRASSRGSRSRLRPNRVGSGYRQEKGGFRRHRLQIRKPNSCFVLCKKSQ